MPYISRERLVPANDGLDRVTHKSDTLTRLKHSNRRCAIDRMTKNVKNSQKVSNEGLVTSQEELGIEWRITDHHVYYPDAIDFMEERVSKIVKQEAPETVWLLEHPPLYTAGTSADREDLIDPDRFPVFDAGRGGQYTYHGPGQRIAYVMLDLRDRKSVV